MRSKVIVRRSGSTVLMMTGWRPSTSTAGWLSVVPPVGAGALVSGTAVAAGGSLVGEVLWSGWLRAQPATARLAISRAVAMARMGRMVVIPFGLRDGGGV